jgi:hypothetical protein
MRRLQETQQRNERQRAEQQRKSEKADQDRAREAKRQQALLAQASEEKEVRSRLSGHVNIQTNGLL